MAPAFPRYTPIVEWTLGPLSISPHGLGTAIGFLAGARLLLVTTRRLAIGDQLVYAALTRGAIGAVLGARVAYVVNHLGTFDSPLELLALRSRRRTHDGFLALLFGALYATARLVEDFFRVDETHGTGLTGSQWTALTVTTVATWWLLTHRRTPGRKREDPERVPMESKPGAAP